MRQLDYRSATPAHPEVWALWSECLDSHAMLVSLRRAERVLRPVALNSMLVWILVSLQLLEKTPQPAGLDWDLLPMVSLPRLEKIPRPVSLNRELSPRMVSGGLLEKSPQPGGLHSKSSSLALASVHSPCGPAR
jgi:hypothetical protein